MSSASCDQGWSACTAAVSKLLRHSHSFEATACGTQANMQTTCKHSTAAASAECVKQLLSKEGPVQKVNERVLARDGGAAVFLRGLQHNVLVTVCHGGVA